MQECLVGGQALGREVLAGVRSDAISKVDSRVERNNDLEYLYPLEFQVVQQLYSGGGIIGENDIPDIGIELDDF